MTARRLFVAALSCLISPLFADAAAVISFSPQTQQVVIPLSGGVTIPITVRIATDAGTGVFTGYELPLDIVPASGAGLPAGWSIGSVTQIYSFPGSSGFFQTELTPAEGDLRVGDLTLATGTTLTTDPLELFRFDLNIASTATPGQVSVGVFDGVLLAVGGFERAEIHITATGLINTVAVPEPIVTPLLSIAGLAAWRRRRRRSAQAASVLG